MLLGGIALRMEDKNTVLEWDPERMEFPNCPDANEFVRMKNRDGWVL